MRPCIEASWRPVTRHDHRRIQCYRAGMDPFAIKLLGFAAATCTTAAYAPQFIKV